MNRTIGRFAVGMAAILMAASVVSIAPSADANEFGLDADGCCRTADGSTHSIHQAGLVTYHQTAVQHARNRVDEDAGGPTALQSTLQTHTDVVAMDQYYAADWWGFWTCVAVHASGNCERGEMRFNQVHHDGATQAHRNTTAVHEFGHSLGLDHSTETISPMQAVYPAMPNSDYSPHDSGHVNAHYNY